MIFFTSIFSNYIPRSLLLAESILKNHPNSKVYIFIINIESVDLQSFYSSVDLFYQYPHSLVIASTREYVPQFNSLINRFDVVEIATAVKPFLALRLLDLSQRVIYVDPDCCFYSSLYSLPEFNQTWSLLLTPHILSVNPTSYVSERLFLYYGVFNLGFFGVDKCMESLEFLNWWCSFVDAYGANSPSTGLFVDQKPIDLAPSLLKDLCILRHPGTNVSWWNIFSDYRELVANNKIKYNSQLHELVFYHFSNLDISSKSYISRPIKSFSRYTSSSYTFHDHPFLSSLYTEYFDKLNALTISSSSFITYSNQIYISTTINRFSKLINAEYYRQYSKIKPSDLQYFPEPTVYYSMNLILRVFKLFCAFFASDINYFVIFKVSLLTFLVNIFTPSLRNFSNIRLNDGKDQPQS